MTCGETIGRGWSECTVKVCFYTESNKSERRSWFTLGEHTLRAERLWKSRRQGIHDHMCLSTLR